METIALEKLVANTILYFCENLAELGMPQNEKDPDMWYRYLSPKKQIKVADKLISIMERDVRKFQKNRLSVKKNKIEIPKQ